MPLMTAKFLQKNLQIFVTNLQRSRIKALYNSINMESLIHCSLENRTPLLVFQQKIKAWTNVHIKLVKDISLKLFQMEVMILLS